MVCRNELTTGIYRGVYRKSNIDECSKRWASMLRFSRASSATHPRNRELDATPLALLARGIACDNSTCICCMMHGAHAQVCHCSMKSGHHPLDFGFVAPMAPTYTTSAAKLEAPVSIRRAVTSDNQSPLTSSLPSCSNLLAASCIPRSKQSSPERRLSCGSVRSFLAARRESVRHCGCERVRQRARYRS